MPTPHPRYPPATIVGVNAAGSSTIDEFTAERMVGKQMPGSIERVPCVPYDFTIEATPPLLVFLTNNQHMGSTQLNLAPIPSDSSICCA